MHEMYRSPDSVVKQSVEIGSFFLPVDNHFFAPAGRMSQAVRAATGAGQSAMLGSLPTLGVLVLVGAAFLALMAGTSRWKGVPPILGLAGLLVLVLLMISAKYGLNIIFAKFVTAQIRGYARVGKFVGFLGVFGFSTLLAAFQGRFIESRGGLVRWVAPLLAVAVALVGVADEWPACYVGFYRGWSRFVPDYDDVAGLVKQVEAREPGGMVYVADVGYPDNDRINTICDYRKPYLTSRTIRWSVPFFGVGDQVLRWQSWSRKLPLPELTAVVLAAVWHGQSQRILAGALAVIAVGCLVTVVRRLRVMMRELGGA